MHRLRLKIVPREQRVQGQYYVPIVYQRGDPDREGQDGLPLTGPIGKLQALTDFGWEDVEIV